MHIKQILTILYFRALIPSIEFRYCMRDIQSNVFVGESFQSFQSDKAEPKN